eukprot:Blabericola_migrator_1__5430@NODE_2778_length_2365_cov_9_591384_g1740_i0_p2_GENE_NODE_2778_length_2365_cov_9_591384_g1740_i0NODE_2778_length_2365_cov_9_591384_g1740_i0_p2_ORF_typecomplete_len274_score44_61Branch/PF02485_21/0_0074_NODE_2778_length_2365_cov_9_591384_g1740_i015442365
MKESPIRDPKTCPWKALSPCVYRALEYPYETWPDLGYIMLLSHNAIPLKPFSTMYTDFIKDRRARVSMASWCFAKGTWVPKTATWAAIPREILRPMLERPDWTEMGWLISPFGVGGPEEGQQWRPVMEEFGDEFPGFFHPGIMAGHKGPWGNKVRWHSDCWRGERDPLCHRLRGKPGGTPMYFERLAEAGLLTLLKHPYVWTFRKVSDESVVDTRIGSVPIADYVSAYWGSSYVNLTVSNHPALEEKLTYLKASASVDDNIALWKAQGIYGLI